MNIPLWIQTFIYWFLVIGIIRLVANLLERK